MHACTWKHSLGLIHLHVLNTIEVKQHFMLVQYILCDRPDHVQIRNTSYYSHKHDLWKNTCLKLHFNITTTIHISNLNLIFIHLFDMEKQFLPSFPHKLSGS